MAHRNALRDAGPGKMGHDRTHERVAGLTLLAVIAAAACGGEKGSGSSGVMGNGNFSRFAMPSGRELFHASVAYSRPVGNTDPDADPSTTIRIQNVVVTD